MQIFLENISEQLVVGIKVEAANSEQASGVGKTRDKKVCFIILTPLILICLFCGWEQALCFRE